jgi:hypothetical protein
MRSSPKADPHGFASDRESVLTVHARRCDFARPVGATLAFEASTAVLA